MHRFSPRSVTVSHIARCTLLSLADGGINKNKNKNKQTSKQADTHTNTERYINLVRERAPSFRTSRRMNIWFKAHNSSAMWDIFRRVFRRPNKHTRRAWSSVSAHGFDIICFDIPMAVLCRRFCLSRCLLVVLR